MSASKANGFIFWDSFEEDETSPDLRDMTSWVVCRGPKQPKSRHCDRAKSKIVQCL